MSRVALAAIGVWQDPSRMERRERSAVTSASAFEQVKVLTSFLTSMPRFVLGVAICNANAPCATADGIIAASIGVKSTFTPRRLMPATARIIAS